MKKFHLLITIFNWLLIMISISNSKILNNENNPKYLIDTNAYEHCYIDMSNITYTIIKDIPLHLPIKHTLHEKIKLKFHTITKIKCNGKRNIIFDMDLSLFEQLHDSDSNILYYNNNNI
ncbi:hypothetical protein RFI_30440 [Reticulomyxa filosa]|uniref:Uncharacterized protein n=1 Tax=Reticulomyxa filosa TaxID=46433 RepID=X6M0M1_RETFI|nr:hypothetical protein RFI_30440 [Reticulomyxa filosa]|eukprot:ETO06947.1 hypothetical protein RFI_30440 [Reticulomyxa filosa]